MNFNRTLLTLSLAFPILSLGFTGCSEDPDDVNMSYSCNSNSCQEDANGQYSSLSECENACATASGYKCNYGHCVEQEDGQYATLTECYDSCAGADFTVSEGSGVTDANGNFYPTVVYGNGQEWMSVNLATEKYANGDPIPQVQVNSEWAALTDGAWSTSSGSATGHKLYNCYTVEDSRNLCPTGWHVPSYTEFHTLIDYLGYDYAAVKMRTWGTYTNSSLFSAVATSERKADGTFQSGSASWWTTSQGEPAQYADNNWAFVISTFENVVRAHPTAGKRVGMTIRCIKD